MLARWSVLRHQQQPLDGAGCSTMNKPTSWIGQEARRSSARLMQLSTQQLPSCLALWSARCCVLWPLFPVKYSSSGTKPAVSGQISHWSDIT